MTILYFDCFSGAAGDMILGALLDAGSPEGAVRERLDTLGLLGWDMNVERVDRAGIAATKVTFAISNDLQSRSYRDIVTIVERARIDEPAKRRALDAFRILAAAEGRVHGVSPDDVHFHEAGSLDAILDVVASAIAIEHFMPAHVVASAIATGTCTVEMAHGTFPLPAPAVVEILAGRGATVYGRGSRELITPTGAAILAASADEFASLPAMQLKATGYGAGSQQDVTSNVLRVLVGVASEDQPTGTYVLEANVDDATPEVLAHAASTLLDAGAQDAWIAPIVMKKGRPAFTLSALVDGARQERVTEIFFAETSTLGVRTYEVTKQALDRSYIETDIEGHPVRIKVGRRGDRVVTAAPEYEDAAAAARATGIPLREIYDRALAQARSLGPTPERP